MSREKKEPFIEIWFTNGVAVFVICCIIYAISDLIINIISLY